MDARRLAILLLACTGLAAATVEPLPEAVIADLQTAQAALGADDHAAALTALEPHAGREHPDVLGLRAVALERAGRAAEAIIAYDAALELDPERQSLALALMNLHATREDWSAVLAAAGTHLDRRRAPEAALLMAAQAARHDADAPLATTYAELAQVRFPTSPRPRRLLAALALEREDLAAARAQLDWLLARDGDDPELWRQRAWAAADEAERRRLLELAMLAGDDSSDLRRAWIAALSNADHHAEALRQLERLDLTHPDDRDLALQVALAAGDDARAASILATIPTDERSIDHHRIAARIALAGDDPQAARAALHRLIRLGAADEAILLQAGRLAEEADEPATAEAHYRQAGAEGSTTATLYLARLLIAQDRREEARQLLADLAASHPELTIARQMLALLDRDPAAR